MGPEESRPSLKVITGPEITDLNLAAQRELKQLDCPLGLKEQDTSATSTLKATVAS